jgi:hypothetical protein
VHEYRVSKYDPSRRDEHGAYPDDDWTVFADIGREFGGVVLTRAEYERVENAYLDAVRIFAAAGGLDEFFVRGLEGRSSLVEGQRLGLAEAVAVVRGLLREQGFWCRLAADGGFLHVGWDYYLHVGVAADASAIVPEVAALGLHVEPGA